MIRRKAVIVSAPREVGGGFEVLAGVSMDVARYVNYLRSDYGGAWIENEIVVLSEPTTRELLRVLAAVVADFTITIFSGHGDAQGDGQSRLWINPHEYILTDEFLTPAARQITICDTCRAIEVPRKLAEEKRAELGRVPDAYRESCRAKFDECVAVAPESREVLFACGIGETATDLSTGGLFSKSLLDVALAWAADVANQHCRVRAALDVRQAYYLAKAAVGRHNRPGQKQTPEIVTHRGSNHVPFTVA